jgi:hypothetical protein
MPFCIPLRKTRPIELKRKFQGYRMLLNLNQLDPVYDPRTDDAFGTVTGTDFEMGTITRTGGVTSIGA